MITIFKWNLCLVAVLLLAYCVLMIHNKNNYRQIRWEKHLNHPIKELALELKEKQKKMYPMWGTYDAPCVLWILEDNKSYVIAKFNERIERSYNEDDFLHSELLIQTISYYSDGFRRDFSTQKEIYIQDTSYSCYIGGALEILNDNQRLCMEKWIDKNQKNYAQVLLSCGFDKELKLKVELENPPIDPDKLSNLESRCRFWDTISKKKIRAIWVAKNVPIPKGLLD